MEATEIEWVSPTIPSDVFFTRAEFEKYSFQNRLIECLLQKEEELGPKSKLLNPDVKANTESENPVSATAIPEPVLQSDSQQTQTGAQVLPSQKKKVEVSKIQLKEKKACTQVKKKDGTLDSSEQKLDGNAGETSGTKSEVKKSKEPKSNLWAELLASQDEPAPSSKCKGKKVCAWYPKLPYPRPSWLTMQEQADYLDLLSKQNPGRQQNQLQQKEMVYFKELHQKVAPEQEEFMRYLESYAAHFPEHYQKLHDDAAGFINVYRGYLHERVVNYPQFYVQLDSVTLLPQRTMTAPVALTHLRTLLQMGRVPRVLLPTMNVSTNKVAPGPAKLKKRFCTARDDSRRPACSFDSNAESLAMKYEADVVISSAGLKCLIDNHAPHFDRQWELPIVIKEYKLEGDSGTQLRKVIYIDKPFPPKNPTSREKNAWYYKFAVKSYLQHPDHPKEHTFHETEQKDEKAEVEMEESEEASLAELETFGNATSVNRPSAFKRYVRPEGKIADVRGSKSPPDRVLGKHETDERSDPCVGESSNCKDESVDKALVRSSSEGFVVSVGDPFKVDPSSKSLQSQPTFMPCDQDMEHAPGQTEQEEFIQEAESEGDIRNLHSSENDTSDDQFTIDVQSEGHDRDTKDHKPVRTETNSLDGTNKPESASDKDIKEEETPTRQETLESVISTDIGSLLDFPKGQVINPVESDGDSDEESALIIDLPGDPLPDPEVGVTRRSLRLSTRKETVSKSSTTSIEAEKQCSDPVGRDTSTEGTSGPDSRKRGRNSHTGQTATKDVCTSKTEEVCSPRSLRSRARLTDQPESNSKGCDPAPHPEGSDDDTSTSRRGRVFKKKLEDSTATLEDMGSPARRQTRSQAMQGLSSQKHSSPSCKMEGSQYEETFSSPKGNEIISPPKRRKKGETTSEMGLSGVPVTTPASPDNKDMFVEQSHDGGSRGGQGDTAPSVIPKTFPLKIIPLEPIQKGPLSELQPDDTKCYQESVPKSGDIGTVVRGENSNDVDKMAEPTTKKPGCRRNQGNLQKGRKVGQVVPLSTLDSIMQAQEKFLETNKKPQVEPTTQEASLGPGTAGEPVYQPLASDDWKAAEDPTHYKSYDQRNLTYNLWALGNIRVLVRCGYHGNMKVKKNVKKGCSFVHLHSKLEYQPFFGAEQVTSSEAARNWIDSYIRNATKIIRARINSFTSEVMLLDHLQLADTLPKSGCFNPCIATSVLHGVMEKLSRLPAGHYLLGHVPGNMHAHIQKNVETTSGVYDLHFAYLRGLPAPDRTQRLPWIPIDPNIQLFFHKKFKRVPATFEPKDSPNLQLAHQFKGKKKRKK